jgi:uncharacterized protein (TIGR03546 family)
MITIFLFIKKCLGYLNSNESIENISYSLTIAFVFALIPFNIIIHSLLVIFLVALNGNALIFLFITPILSIITPNVYQEVHLVGDLILSQPSAQPFFYKLATVPLLGFSSWNNTVTMGAYAVSLISCVPLYFFYFFLLTLYRRHVLSKLKNSRMFKWTKSLSWMTYFLGKK